MAAKLSSPNTVSTTFKIHREARAFLDTLVAGKYGHGQVISQLILAEKVRRETREEERQRIRDGLSMVLS
jgi:hypothetical protein